MSHSKLDVCPEFGVITRLRSRYVYLIRGLYASLASRYLGDSFQAMKGDNTVTADTSCWLRIM